MTKPLVFISYSHKDEKEKDRLISHLGVLEHSGLIDLWVDDKIEGGIDWEDKIKQEIAKANIAILLISANFLNSEFILSKEVPDFLKRRQDEGLKVFPIIAKPCVWETFAWLAKMNVRPKNGVPIWSSNNNKAIDDRLATITREIKEIVQKIPASNIKIKSSPNKFSTPAYTAFQQDLENLIQQATNDFINIKEDTPNSPVDGYTSYESSFSFEYSINNTIWQRNNGKWYFSCSFCKDATLQQASVIFMERVQEIKSILSSDWKFEEREKPDSLHKKEFEAIKKYNTLRIRMRVVAYNSGNNSEVDFWLEQLP